MKRRQQGTSAYYSIADKMVFELCDMVCSRLRDRLEAQAGAFGARLRAIERGEKLRDAEKRRSAASVPVRALRLAR